MKRVRRCGLPSHALVSRICAHTSTQGRTHPHIHPSTTAATTAENGGPQRNRVNTVIDREGRREVFPECTVVYEQYAPGYLVGTQLTIPAMRCDPRLTEGGGFVGEQRLPRGGIYLSSDPPIQIGMPPETIKDILTLGLTMPRFVHIVTTLSRLPHHASARASGAPRRVRVPPPNNHCARVGTTSLLAKCSTAILG